MIYALPTDTCYGIGCPIIDASGYERIYAMKGRDFDKPLAILLRTYRDLLQFSDLSEAQIKTLQEYPHPFTILVTPSEKFTYPAYMDRRKYAKIAFRVAEQCVPEEVREELPYPIFLTSANKSGEPETYASDEVTQTFALWVDDMKIFDGTVEKKPASNIFEFTDKTDTLSFLRKNYE